MTSKKSTYNSDCRVYSKTDVGLEKKIKNLLSIKKAKIKIRGTKVFIKPTSITIDFVDGIKKLLMKCEKSETFKFITMLCGENKDFSPPWTISNEYCDFEPNLLEDFLIKAEKKMTKEDYKSIKWLLNRKDIFIDHLDSANYYINFYKRKSWTFEEIMSMSSKNLYYLIINDPAVIYFLYNDEKKISYIIEDDEMDSKSDLSTLYKMKSFLTGNDYKILKALRGHIIPKMKFKFLLDIDYYVGLKIRKFKNIKMLIFLHHYNMNLFDQANNLSRLKSIDYLYRERDGTEIDVIQFSKTIIKRYIHSLIIKDISIFTSMYRTSIFSKKETEFFNSIHNEVALNSRIPNHKFQECYYVSRNKDIFRDLPGERFSLQKKEEGTLYFDGGPINSEDELKFLNDLTKTQNKEKMQSYLVSGLLVKETIFIPDFLRKE